ncbi:MAG TPA: DUF4395 domain-containing protein [Helicobacteraceae bacterium]|nr:DUF4395 domain-containing protein [Helicobacteraceae bacterium]
MSQTCPLIFRQIDGTIARLNALFVSLFVILFLVSHELVWLYFVGLDFIIRLYGHKPYSPLYQLAMFVQKVLRLPQNMTDAGAKRLAALFGLFFVFLLIVTGHLGLIYFNYAIAAAFLACTSLELAFSYCVGCKVYWLIKKIYPRFMEV